MTSAQYRRLLIDARRRQLTLSQETVSRIERILLRSARQVRGLYRNPPEGYLENLELYRRFLRERHDHLVDLADNVLSDYGQALGAGMLQHAQAAVDRERRVGELSQPRFHDAEMEPAIRQTFRMGAGGVARIEFSRVAVSAVEATMRRVLGDGLQLSDRIWRLGEFSRQGLEDTIVAAVANGMSARDLADHLRGFLIDEHSDNARYRCLRLARTEIVTAYREGAARSMLDPATGRLRSYIAGARWTLSASHPKVDACDLYASDDPDGLGQGVYLPESLPVGHANCMCYVSSELVDYPEVTAPSLAPRPDDVSDAEVERLARGGDPTAQRERGRRQRAA